MTSAANTLDPGSTYPVFMIFTIFVGCALFLSVWVTPDRGTTSDFYLSERRLTSTRNGFAFFGDYMSAATLLGTPGLVALTGYDGIPYLLGPIVAWVVIMMLIAEPYHSAGRFTVGDFLARRLRPRPAHRAAGVATLVISLLYLIAQLVGAGALAAPILGMSGAGAQRTVVACLGGLMVLYVLIGGMRAATLVQSIKAVLLLGTGIFLTVLVLSRFHWSPGGLLSSAATRSGFGDAFLRPGVRFGDDIVDKFDFMSLQMGVLLGAAGLPHLLMRLGAVRTARQARRSVQWATFLTLAFCVMAGVLGFGAVALLGRSDITADSPTGNTATLLLANFLGGPLVMTLVSCVAFATILAVVAGITLTAATSLAHDIYSAVLTRGTASEKTELLVARAAVVLIGATATVLSMFAQNLNITFLVAVAFAVAGAAILPALLYGLYWEGFTTKGASWSIYGGLVSSLVLVAFSPAVSGNAAALLPHSDFSVFPLRNPAIVSIPIGFLMGWLGSALDTREPGGADFAETEVRVLTGAGARSD